MMYWRGIGILPKKIRHGKVCEMKCNCDGWKDSEPQIYGAQVLACTHGMPYTGARFKYCPWCGKELKSDDEVDEKALGWRESELAGE